MSLTIEIDGTRADRAVQHGHGRDVVLVCPVCGEERTGRLIRGDAGGDAVECGRCAYRTDPGVLEIPTEAMLTDWRAQAVRHARISVRCADASASASYLAVVWCRRLACELIPWGKSSLLDEVLHPIGADLTDAQRCVVLDLGIALGARADDINRVLALDATNATS
jgi:predicted RNA-binding Zn-ribbon protein involved in translation (DUF1610 family)